MTSIPPGSGPHSFGRLAPTVLAVALAASMAGCATVRRARDVQAGRTPAPGERTLAAAAVGLTAQTVLTPEDALKIALAQHPSIAQATQSVVAAHTQLRGARAAWWPSADASAGYSRATANTAGQPASGTTHGAYSGALSADLLLYDFGRTPAAVRQALERVVAAEEGWRTARNDVAYAVRTAFYSLGKAQELLQVSDEAVRQYQVRLDQVKAFAEVGERMRYDVTKAEVDLGNAELARVTASNDVSNARAALVQSLGLADDPGFGVTVEPPAGEVAARAALMETARNRHPELRALRAQERVASAAVDAAIADLYPSLSLRAQAGESGRDFPLVWNWSGAVQGVWNLFSGGAKLARIDEAAAQLRSARARLAAREQQLGLELSQALNQWSSARQKQGLSELLVRQAQESLTLIEERYRIGAASAVEVTDAQAALTSARGDQVRARFDVFTAMAQIRHTTGEDE